MLILLTGARTTLSAQATDRPDEVHHRNECRKARQILVHGQPANQLEWANRKILECEDVPETIAEALLAHRGDETRSEEVDRLVTMTSGVVDASIFEAALEIASDPSAGRMGRLEAMRVLHNQMWPMTYQTFEAFVTETLPPLPESGEPLVITPLPRNAGALAAAAMSDVLNENLGDSRITAAVEKIIGGGEALEGVLQEGQQLPWIAQM